MIYAINTHIIYIRHDNNNTALSSATELSELTKWSVLSRGVLVPERHSGKYFQAGTVFR